MLFNMLSQEQIDNILNFWFVNNKYNKFWFQKNIIMDKLIYDNYYQILIEFYEKYKSNDNFRFTTDKNQLLACIILLDQFARNMSRVDNTLTVEKINNMTCLARILTLQWINLEFYKSSLINHCVFALMPLRHLNNITDYKLILSVMENIYDKENETYIKFIFHTKKRLELLH
jgi:uncharacterized protein (DUF924 family)